MNYWLETENQLNDLVNQWYDTSEIKQILGLPLTHERWLLYRTQRKYFGRNRRDCWAAVMSKGPLDVKRAIWEHEKDELIFDSRMGKAHVAEEDFVSDAEARIVPGAQVTFYAWLYCVREEPWISGLASCHILERRNNDTIVRGGTLTQRLVRKWETETGGSLEDLDSGTRVHMIADVEHSDIFTPVFERYVVDKDSMNATLLGASQSLLIERSFVTAVVNAMMEK